MKPYVTISVLALIIFQIAILPGCKKDKITGPATKLGGVRNWHRIYSSYGNLGDTSYYLHDTSFAISIIDGSTVKFKYIEEYQKTDSAKELLWFSGVGYTVIYYYNKDSISIYGIESTNHYGGHEFIYFTY